MIASLILSLGLVGWLCFREFVANRLEATAQAAGQGGDKRSVSRWLAVCGPTCPARAYEAASQAYLELARHAPLRERTDLLERAQSATEAGLQRNPISSEAWARLALIRSEQAGGRATPAAVTALTHSYAAASYSRGAAKWRITFCTTHWNQLTPALRAAALAETVWLAKINGGEAYDLVHGIEDPFIRQLFEIRVLPPPED